MYKNFGIGFQISILSFPLQTNSIRHNKSEITSQGIGALEYRYKQKKKKGK